MACQRYRRAHRDTFSNLTQFSFGDVTEFARDQNGTAAEVLRPVQVPKPLTQLQTLQLALPWRVLWLLC